MKEGSSRGRLIALEGIDGSGKSTHLKLAARALREKGFEVAELKEPTGGQWGERIRWLREGDVTGREEVELFLKDRQEDVQHNIEPALEAGKIVLIDRYYFSTMAYQGARGIDVEEIRKLNEEFAPVPDLVIIFDVPVDVGLDRIKANRRSRHVYFERGEYLKKVAEIYQEMRGENIVHIDAAKSVEDVAQEVMGKIEERLLGSLGT